MRLCIVVLVLTSASCESGQPRLSDGVRLEVHPEPRRRSDGTFGVRCKCTFTNRTDAPVLVYAPVGGSFINLFEPYYEVTLKKADGTTIAPDVHGSYIVADYETAAVSIPASSSRTVDTWLPYGGLRQGTSYVLQVSYTVSPTTYPGPLWSSKPGAPAAPRKPWPKTSFVGSLHADSVEFVIP